MRERPKATVCAAIFLELLRRISQKIGPIKIFYFKGVHAMVAQADEGVEIETSFSALPFGKRAKCTLGYLRRKYMPRSSKSRARYRDFWRMSLNFRRLRQDFAPAVLKEGKHFFEQDNVVDAKVLHVSEKLLRICCEVTGAYEHVYRGELELDRTSSSLADSSCTCSQKFDCQHLAAILFYLEEHFERLLARHAQGEGDQGAGPAKLLKNRSKLDRELLKEYAAAADVLATNPFFMPPASFERPSADLLLAYNLPPSKESTDGGKGARYVEVQLAIRLPGRSKPIQIRHLREFLDSLRYGQPILLLGQRMIFAEDQFESPSSYVATTLSRFLTFPLPGPQTVESRMQASFASAGLVKERMQRNGLLPLEIFAELLADLHAWLEDQPHLHQSAEGEEDNLLPLPGIYRGGFDQPALCCRNLATVTLQVDQLALDTPKLVLKPYLRLQGALKRIGEVELLHGKKPGALAQGVYSRFHDGLLPAHLRLVHDLDGTVIPLPLIGTFIENSLPELQRVGQVLNPEHTEDFATLPFSGELKARCHVCYVDGKLEAQLFFRYDLVEIPAISTQLKNEDLAQFVTSEGILARDLSGECSLVDTLFHDFVCEAHQGVYLAKSDKKVIEFMTEIVPAHRQIVDFELPQNLLDQFLYDDTHLELFARPGKSISSYEIHMVVHGALESASLDQLLDCLLSDRCYLEVDSLAGTAKVSRPPMGSKLKKLIVLNLKRLAPLVDFLDDLAIKRLATGPHPSPLWTLTQLDVENLPQGIEKLEIDPVLLELQKQMRGQVPYEPQKIPSSIKVELRPYQLEGIGWLGRLRSMRLGGILADDMGLGKTLQSIVALLQMRDKQAKSSSLVVCPTSLLYNWKEEIAKFAPQLKVLVVDGAPVQRKKLLEKAENAAVIITSYTLLQKDIEYYQKINFGYAILDEAQHIKNRSTRNAKAVKLVNSTHKLILTGTPVENNLQELWSLFDFLMPGLLGSYERFIQKYFRGGNRWQPFQNDLEKLKRKVMPFILRRMKADVLKELPPVTEIVYHCSLTDSQRELYRSYAESARKELTSLVKKEGFESVQIHVLATLTRLKQICCHPAIFAKQSAASCESAKYQMFVELVENLIDSGHKAVVFSQYTKMLQIIREDFSERGIPYLYLDGSSKNRMQLVHRFNDDQKIPIFLVSLKAGGTGLNLTGADTVIHYDMWWNPAVENQATDRVHRLGQDRSVSSYKLVTLGTIEEKIVELQNRKRGLARKVVTTDDEAIAKLTWDEVLELLKT